MFVVIENRAECPSVGGTVWVVDLSISNHLTVVVNTFSFEFVSGNTVAALFAIRRFSFQLFWLLCVCARNEWQFSVGCRYSDNRYSNSCFLPRDAL